MLEGRKKSKTTSKEQKIPQSNWVWAVIFLPLIVHVIMSIRLSTWERPIGGGKKFQSNFKNINNTPQHF